MLGYDHKAHYMASWSWLLNFVVDGKEFLKKIVTGDKTQVQYNTQKQLRHQSFQTDNELQDTKKTCLMSLVAKFEGTRKRVHQYDPCFTLNSDYAEKKQRTYSLKHSCISLPGRSWHYKTFVLTIKLLISWQRKTQKVSWMVQNLMSPTQSHKRS